MPVTPLLIRTTDPDDDIVIATAISGNAEVICTRDRHFYSLTVQAACATFGIQIMNEVELLTMLRGVP